jgi:hypothetical protein
MITEVILFKYIQYPPIGFLLFFYFLLLNLNKMKELLFFSALLCAIASLSCNKEIKKPLTINGPIQSDAAVVRSGYEDSYQLEAEINSPCTPEIIKVSGTQHITYSLFYRDNKYHVNARSRLSDGKAIGVTSGNVYSITEHSNNVSLGTFVDLINPEVRIANYRGRYVIRSAETGDTFIAIGIVQLHFDVNGTLIKFVNEITEECE